MSQPEPQGTSTPTSSPQSQRLPPFSTEKKKKTTGSPRPLWISDSEYDSPQDLSFSQLESDDSQIRRVKEQEFGFDVNPELKERLHKLEVWNRMPASAISESSFNTLVQQLLNTLSIEKRLEILETNQAQLTAPLPSSNLFCVYGYWVENLVPEKENLVVPKKRKEQARRRVWEEKKLQQAEEKKRKKVEQAEKKRQQAEEKKNQKLLEKAKKLQNEIEKNGSILKQLDLKANKTKKEISRQKNVGEKLKMLSSRFENLKIDENTFTKDKESQNEKDEESQNEESFTKDKESQNEKDEESQNEKDEESQNENTFIRDEESQNEDTPFDEEMFENTIRHEITELRYGKIGKTELTIREEFSNASVPERLIISRSADYEIYLSAKTTDNATDLAVQIVEQFLINKLKQANANQPLFAPDDKLGQKKFRPCSQIIYLNEKKWHVRFFYFLKWTRVSFESDYRDALKLYEPQELKETLKFVDPKDHSKFQNLGQTEWIVSTTEMWDRAKNLADQNHFADLSELKNFLSKKD